MLVSVFSAKAVVKRGLASTVLLSRTWESQTVAQLRQETKSRGLSSAGNKASLIQRLKDAEALKSKEAPAAPVGARAASTTAAVDPTIFNIQIPDLSQPVPEVPVQVPYVPDFWDSAHQPIVPKPEGSIPKLLVVAGATTHHGGGPSHNALPDAREDVSSASTPAPVPKAAPTPSGPGGLFFDMAEDLGLLSQVPAAKPARTPFWQLFG